MKISNLKNYKNGDNYIDLSNGEFNIKKTIEGNYWLYFEDGSALLKNLKSENDDHLDNFYELLYSQICDKYKINSAKYDLVKYKDLIGVISYNLNNFNDFKYQTLFEHISSNLKRKLEFYDFEYVYMNTKTLHNYFIKHFKSNAKELYGNLLKIITLDTILKNWDRHCENILISKNNDKVELVVIDSSNILDFNSDYDTERQYEFICFYNTLNEKEQKIIFNFIKNFDVTDIVEKISKKYKLFNNYRKDTIDNINNQVNEIKNCIERASFFKKNKTFHLSKYYINSTRYRDDWLDKLLEGLETSI